MTTLTALVQTTTYDMTPSTSRLSPAMWRAFSALNQVHGIWRWIRRIELYRNPDNFAQLLAGHAVNFALGDVTLLRIAAQCLLISTRILTCVQQQAVLHRSGKRLIAACKGHYPLPIQESWDTAPIKTWKTAFTPLWNRIKRVALCTLNLLKQTFLLSMSLMDAMDTFCLSPYTRNEGINEGFVNAFKWLNTIVDNKEELLAGIVKNRSIIERILEKSPFTYTQLCDAVTNALEKTELVSIKAKKISSVGNGILVDIGKRMASGAMIIIGLADYRPTIFSPVQLWYRST